MSETVRINMRGFLGDKLIFLSQMELDDKQIDSLVPELAEKHAEEMVASKLSMIEFEFPDDPPEARFMRLGLDASGMMMPIQINLNSVKGLL
jgi:hypothetical protein